MVEIVIAPMSNARPWLEGESLDVARPIAFTQDALVDAARCQRLIAELEARGFEDAPITTARGFVHNRDVRNNTRVMYDDRALAAELWAWVEPLVPPRLCDRRPVGMNERFRGYRYNPGERFAPHYDGCFRRNEREESLLTFMLYLNEGMKGGQTIFHHHDAQVLPRTGRALFFQHMLLHEGAVITEGVKYVLRSDVMYARD